MTRYWKILIVCILFLGIAQAASASISVSNIAITPSGDLVSGQTSVTASFVVDFIAGGGDTFPSEDTLQLSTDLSNAHWTKVLLLDGVENPQPIDIGPNVNINGWTLSYPSNKEVQLKVSLEGTTPTVSQSGEITVFKVADLNARNQADASSQVIKKKMVLNPSEITSAIPKLKTDLAGIKAVIDQLNADGVDVSAAETKYNDAMANIQKAESTTNYSNAQTYVSQVQKSITDLNTLLKQLQTTDAINKASVPIDQTDEIITYFQVNKSMSNDARLSPIITKRERAADLLVDARDLSSQGSYDEATNKANEALAKGQEALADAQALKTEVDSNPLSGIGNALGGAGGAIGGVLIYIGVIVLIVVVAVVGIVLFRRRRRWDELG
ncbi:hypothetical protein J2741_000964 [Methanolinea mesophila]|uniref:hypothetical protein n=1 Tax=Methanolinea mesophila TaxID=547055 RepID=UPI001AEBA3D2|nr:hypothetical protein [Methanolinea mesophila]MBP1928417.1 hypothetical protein [Methanolinea mesophila]